MKPKFSSGDKVFAKVRGYPPWPARVEGLADETPNKMRYHIYFYGTGETAVVKGEDICSFVENKIRLGKPKKHKNFTEALIQIEAELSPEEQQTLAELEQTAREQSSLNDTLGDESRRSSGVGRSKTSLSPTPKGKSKDKKRKVDSDSGTEEDQKKKASVLSNSDTDLLNNKNAEVMSRSGRKIKPKRFADFEDETNEDQSPTLHPVKPISKVAPVKKIDKDEEENFLIAYINNDKLKIPLGLNQPHFTEPKALAEWKFKEHSYASALKKRLEAGDTLPLTPHDLMYNWTKESSVQSKRSEENSLRGDLLKIETSLLELDLSIRSALNIKCADTKRCLNLLDKLSQLKLTPLMLKKHPDVVHTIKKVRRYVGNVPRALTELEEQEFLKDAEEIRNKAEHVYCKFQGLFFIPGNKSFWDVFEEEKERFDKLTKHMSSEDIVGLIKEPE